jgi:hypothetical protein
VVPHGDREVLVSWVDPAEPMDEPAPGRRIAPLFAVAVLGILVAAVAMRVLPGSGPVSTLPPGPVDVRVTRGASEGWVASPDAGSGGVLIIPLTVRNAGRTTVVLTGMTISGPGASLSTDARFDVSNELPETLQPGQFAVLSLPMEFRCPMPPRPEPVVVLTATERAGSEHRLVVRPSDLEPLWGTHDSTAQACPPTDGCVIDWSVSPPAGCPTSRHL